LPHAITAALFSGTAEPLALALKQAGHESAFFYYVVGCSALTLVAALFMAKGKGGTTLDPETENPARDGREEDRDDRRLERV